MGKTKRLAAGKLVSIIDLARVTGFDEGTIRRWTRAGCPFTREGTRLQFDPAAVKAWLDERGKKPGQRGRPAAIDGAPSDVKESLALAKLRKELALAERAELDVAERKGELMPRAEVEQATVARILEVRAALLGLAARVTPRVVGQDGATVHGIVDEEARRICEGFAEGST